MHPPCDFSLDLDGRVALVTGASSGLGWRFAQTLAAAGAKVAVGGRRVDRVRELAALIASDGGGALAVSLDVRDAASIVAAFDAAEQAFGTVDILVNNAGIGDSQAAVDMSLETIDDLIGTNLRAPYIASCEFARRLFARGGKGRIVNIASVGAYHYPVNAGAAFYCTTKAAVVRLTETLAMEWARQGINVNAIAPGLFRSEMSQGYIDHVGDAAFKGGARKRLGEPHNLDGTLLYLVSPSSEYVTGICLRVDDAQMPR